MTVRDRGAERLRRDQTWIGSSQFPRSLVFLWGVAPSPGPLLTREALDLTKGAQTHCYTVIYTVYWLQRSSAYLPIEDRDPGNGPSGIRKPHRVEL